METQVTIDEIAEALRLGPLLLVEIANTLQLSARDILSVLQKHAESKEVICYTQDGRVYWNITNMKRCELEGRKAPSGAQKRALKALRDAEFAENIKKEEQALEERETPVPSLIPCGPDAEKITKRKKDRYTIKLEDSKRVVIRPFVPATSGLSIEVVGFGHVVIMETFEAGPSQRLTISGSDVPKLIDALNKVWAHA